MYANLFTSTTKFPDGRTTVSTATFTKEGLTQVNIINAPDGSKVMEMVLSGVLVDAETFNRRREELLGNQ